MISSCKYHYQHSQLPGGSKEDSLSRARNFILSPWTLILTHSLHWLLCSWKWKRWGSGWECCLLRLSGEWGSSPIIITKINTLSPPLLPAALHCSSLKNYFILRDFISAVVCSSCIHSDVYSLIFWNVKDWPHFMEQLNTWNYLPPINFFEGNCISCFPIEIFLLLQETWYNCCLEDL